MSISQRIKEWIDGHLVYWAGVLMVRLYVRLRIPVTRHSWFYPVNLWRLRNPGKTPQFRSGIVQLPIPRKRHKTE